MSTLLQKSQEILDEKNAKILPGNIKAGVQIFDIEGTYTGGGGTSDLKTFSTIEEMQADIDKQEGDEAVVYRNGLGPATQSSTITSCVFPSVVHINFDSEDTITGEYMDYGTGTNYYVSLDQTTYVFSNESDLRITYTSDDGKTYTRIDGGSDKISFAALAFSFWSTEWHDEFGQFTLVSDEYFGGMFQCEYVEENNEEVLQYVPMDNQLDATASDVFGKTFYGTNGVQIGTLGSTVANSFDDSSAQAYVAIQDAYDNMEPVILTDIYRTINTGMYLIPTKTNGLPLIDTGNVTDMSEMFSGLSHVKSIPALNTNNVTNMYGAFQGSTNLTTISNLNTSNVTNMCQMFVWCNSLTTVPNFNTSNVTNMNGMFMACYNLTNVPIFDTSNVTDMSSMLSECTNLTTVPNFDTSNVVTMTSAFTSCGLTTVPNFSTSNVTNMNSMFTYCGSLTNIPDFDTSNVTDMSSMFTSCLNLTDVPNFNTSNVTDMSGMFEECQNLTNASLDNILQMCADSAVTGNKTLASIGLNPDQADICMNLSNYQNFVNAGWTTGY